MTEPRISPELPEWIKDHLKRYIESNGEDGHLWDASLGGGTGMVPTLLLTTTGRKSGKPLMLPLIYGRAGDAYVVVASKGGAPAHPAWYLNLAADPEVQVQVGQVHVQAHKHQPRQQRRQGSPLERVTGRMCLPMLQCGLARLEGGFPTPLAHGQKEVRDARARLDIP